MTNLPARSGKSSSHGMERCARVFTERNPVFGMNVMKTFVGPMSPRLPTYLILTLSPVSLTWADCVTPLMLARDPLIEMVRLGGTSLLMTDPAGTEP